MRSFGVTTESRLIWSSGNDLLFFVMLSILFGGMMAGAVLLGGRKTLASYREILKSYGLSGTDYIKENGGPAAVFNMGLNGLFAVVFVLAVGGDLNGPTIGSIFRQLWDFLPQENISVIFFRLCWGFVWEELQKIGIFTIRLQY